MGIDGTLSRRELLREGLTLAAVATIAAAALRAWRDRNRYDDLDGCHGCHGCHWLSSSSLAVTAVTGCHRLSSLSQAVTGCHSWVAARHTSMALFKFSIETAQVSWLRSINVALSIWLVRCGPVLKLLYSSSSIATVINSGTQFITYVLREGLSFCTQI